MSEAHPRPETSLSRWVSAVLAATVVASIGLPLLGVGVFHASDVLGTFAPWSQATPFDFRPDNAFVTDTVNAVVPMRAEFRNRVFDGDLPLWNPLSGSGEPLAAVPNVGTFSPLNLTYLAAPLWLAPVLTKLVEVLVAVGFTFLLARRLGRSRPAAWLAALVFVNSAFLVVWTNWPQSHVGALIPALLWAIEYGVSAPRHRAVWPVTVVAAVMWLEGFPSVTSYALLTGGAYALVRALVVHGRHRAAAARLGALGGAVALSLGVAALQLLPFAGNLATLDLSHRDVGASWHLPWQVLATLGVPDAFGNPVDGVFYMGFEYANYVEGQSFVGMTALVLLGVAAVGGRRVASRGQARGFLWATLVVGVVIAYLGGPLLWLISELPLVGPNFIGRYRSVIGLAVALLAAYGFDALLRRGGLAGGPDGREGRGDRGGRSVPPVVGVVVVGVGAVGALGWAALRAAAAVDALPYLVAQTALPGAVALAAVLALVASRHERVPPWAAVGLPVGLALVVGVALVARFGPGDVVSLLRRHATLYVVVAVVGLAVLALALRFASRRGLAAVVVLLPVLLAMESVAFARPWWADTPRELFYPETAAHEFVRASLGSDRLAAAGNAMYPGTTMVYGLRSFTAHAHQLPSYREYVRALHPQAYARSSSFPLLAASAEVAGSPLLDRAAARVWVAAPTDPIIGARETVREASGGLDLRGGEELAIDLPAGPLRGVVLDYRRAAGLAGEPALTAEVAGPDGTVIASGSTRLHHWVPTGDLPVALGEVDVPDGATLRIGLERRDEAGAVDGRVRLGAADGADGAPALDVVRPADDGLALEFVDGAVVYQRRAALPRIRWAGRAEVVADPEQRLERLAGGLDDDVVVLSDGQPDATADAAALDVVEDSGDVVEVEVDAEGAGYLVVADGIQYGWQATVDGAPVEVLAADHAFGAVAVGPGRHVVQLRYDPPGWSSGQFVTLVSLVILAGLVVADRRVRR